MHASTSRSLREISRRPLLLAPRRAYEHDRMWRAGADLRYSPIKRHAIAPALLALAASVRNCRAGAAFVWRPIYIGDVGKSAANDPAYAVLSLRIAAEHAPICDLLRTHFFEKPPLSGPCPMLRWVFGGCGSGRGAQATAAIRGGARLLPISTSYIRLIRICQSQNLIFATFRHRRGNAFRARQARQSESPKRLPG